MSNNLTIPAAVWACRVDGVPLVAGIVEGSPCPWVNNPPMTAGLCRWGTRTHLPVDLVALRDARCETCEGRGIVIGPWGDDDEIECPDPRCVDGRLLADVRVECWECYESGFPINELIECEAATCDAGFRTVKGLVDVIRVNDVFGPILDEPELSIDSTAGTVWTIGVGGRKDRPLTPAHVEALGTIQPGQWAWLFTEVEA